MDLVNKIFNGKDNMDDDEKKKFATDKSLENQRSVK